MFDTIGLSDEPITPSQLSSFRIAMNTTVIGLIIALPSIILGHLYSIWANQAVRRLH